LKLLFFALQRAGVPGRQSLSFAGTNESNQSKVPEIHIWLVAVARRFGCCVSEPPNSDMALAVAGKALVKRRAKLAFLACRQQPNPLC
jgi:hypothetical protein